jgi:hypothetical protein
LDPTTTTMLPSMGVMRGQRDAADCNYRGKTRMDRCLSRHKIDNTLKRLTKPAQSTKGSHPRSIPPTRHLLQRLIARPQRRSYLRRRRRFPPKRDAGARHAAAACVLIGDQACRMLVERALSSSRTQQVLGVAEGFPLAMIGNVTDRHVAQCMPALRSRGCLHLHVGVYQQPLRGDGGQIQRWKLGVGRQHCSVDVVIRHCKVKEPQS